MTMRVRTGLLELAGIAMAVQCPASARDPSAVSIVRQRYETLLRLREQFRQCVGRHGVAPQPARLVPHERTLARLRLEAGRSGAAVALAAVDRNKRRLIDAVDTSCLVGPTEAEATAIDGYERDLRNAERDLSLAIRRLARTPRPAP